MRKIYFITILILMVNFYLCAQTGIRTAFYGGIGFCTNEGSYPMNPGLNLHLESEYKPIRFIGVGCDADYTWFPVRKDVYYVGKYKVGYNY
jgi:hypothetical protein